MRNRCAVLSIVSMLPIVCGIKVEADGGSLFWATMAAIVGIGFGTGSCADSAG